MTSNMCRSLLIESMSLSDQTLSSIGKRLSETLRLAINRVTERPTITHLIAYLVDIQTTQIYELLAIKSEEFSIECLSKLSLLKRPTKQLIPNRNICENIALILKDIKQMINSSKDVKRTDLTYVSGRDVEEVIDDFIFAFNSQHIDSSFLSQINISIIKSGANRKVAFGPTPTNFTGIPVELRELLEIQTIDESDTTIDGYFKVWLHDLNSDSERVRIYFDSKTGQQTNGKTFVIKCDLREAVIDLNRLLIDKSGKKLNSRQIQALESLQSIYETNGCYELELLGLISRSGLCEAILFGIPYILSATRSPNLDFNEMKVNCSRFQSLIQILNEKNAVIILKTRQQINQNHCLKSLFAMMSSPDSKTLIMKAVATKELVLPNFADTVDTMVSKPPSQSEIDLMRDQLSAFPFADIYNPLFAENNLFNIL